MNGFVFKLSPNIILDKHALAGIGEEAAKYGTNFMFVRDRLFRDTELVDKIRVSLESKGLSIFMFDSSFVTPDSDVIERALTLARGAKIQGVIAFGGIAACAIGRAVAALYNEHKSIYDYIEGMPVSTKPLPFIQIPSYCNDPFVFGNTSYVVDARNRSTALLRMNNPVCSLVIFDSRIYEGLSQEDVTSLIFAGLGTSFEAYISNKSNFLSETILGKAIELFFISLNPHHEKQLGIPKEELIVQAVCLASIGIGVSSPGLGSAVTLACSGRYGILPNEIAIVLLPHIIENSISASLAKTVSFAKMFGSIMPADIDSVGIAQKGIQEIREKISQADLPVNLSSLGLSIESMVAVAEDAAKLSFMNYTPRPMSNRDIFDLIKQAY